MEAEKVETAELTADQVGELQDLSRFFFWLASVDLIYSVEGGLPKTRKVNVLMKTVQPFVNQTTIGNVQKSAQVQAISLKKIPRKAKIDDLVINGPWMIGHMTDEEFTMAQPSQVYVTDEPDDDAPKD